jgi:hypothetical protein
LWPVAILSAFVFAAPISRAWQPKLLSLKDSCYMLCSGNQTLNSRPHVWLTTLKIHNNQGLSKRRMITPWNLIPNQQMMRELSNTSQQQNPCMPIIFGYYSHLQELTFPQ